MHGFGDVFGGDGGRATQVGDGASDRLVSGGRSHEADSTLGRRRNRPHQSPDGVKNDSELSVVFLFKGGEFAGQVCVSGDYLAQAYKGAHDFNVHLICDIRI